MRYLIPLILILIFACNNEHPLSGIWIPDHETKMTDSEFEVIEFEFINDSSGIFRTYSINPQTNFSTREKNDTLFVEKDSFKINNENLLIIPGHLVRPVNYRIIKLTDTLIITHKGKNEIYVKYED